MMGSFCPVFHETGLLFDLGFQTPGLGSSDLIMNLVFELLKWWAVLWFITLVSFSNTRRVSRQNRRVLQASGDPKPPTLVVTPFLCIKEFVVIIFFFLLQICNLQFCEHTRWNRCTHNTSSVPPPPMRYYSFYITLLNRLSFCCCWKALE
jgi:hypothetical protein